MTFSVVRVPVRGSVEWLIAGLLGTLLGLGPIPSFAQPSPVRTGTGVDYG